MTISRASFGLFVICLVDTVLTVVLVATGLAEEANPLMARCLDYGFTCFCLVKMATVVVAVAVAESHRKRNPLFVSFILRVAIIAYVALYFALLLAVNIA